DATRAQLERGQRVMELMKQRQYSPLSISEMAVSLYSAEGGFLDDIELEKVGAFEDALHTFMHSDRADLMKQIDDTGDYNDEIEASLKESIENFKTNHTW
ncbi:MAG: F0F1 ATP synthase subunit alpha, partial [Gammaproteobacteria bacterium]|nr:F0F1 ATP synthase subunit alpha [Gammaproteobacteria bacterium]